MLYRSRTVALVFIVLCASQFFRYYYNSNGHDGFDGYLLLLGLIAPSLFVTFILLFKNAHTDVYHESINCLILCLLLMSLGMWPFVYAGLCSLRRAETVFQFSVLGINLKNVLF
jgi:hypothetical protein